MRKVILVWLVLSGGVYAQDVSWSLTDVQRLTARSVPERVSGNRDQVFAHFVALARDEGRSHEFRWTGDDGEVSLLLANPDGTVTVQQTNRRAAIAPPAERVVYQLSDYQPVPRQAVAAAYAAPTFQRGVQRIPGTPYHEGHRCPACNYESPDGEGTWIIRSGNQRGVHVHSCPRCGQSWRHRG